MGSQEGTPRLKVLVVEDEPLYREMLSLALSQDAGIQVVAAVGDAESALKAARQWQPDVATLDIEIIGSMNGIELGVKLRGLLPRLGIVVLSNHTDPGFLDAIQRRAYSGWSYLLKKSAYDLNTLRRAVKGAACGYVVVDPQIINSARIARGSPVERLTPRQLEILSLMAQGYTNAAIAEALNITAKSVENQINLIYQQLNIDRTDRSVQPRVTAVLEYLKASRSF